MWTPVLACSLTLLWSAICLAAEVPKVADPSLTDVLNWMTIIAETRHPALSVRVIVMSGWDDCDPGEPSPATCGGKIKLYVAVLAADGLTIGDFPGVALYELTGNLWEFVGRTKFAASEDDYTEFVVRRSTVVPVENNNDGPRYGWKHDDIKLSVNTRHAYHEEMH